MEFICSMVLPTDVRFVPVARHFSQNTMAEFGVDAECMASISVAITEACANVVEHSQQSAAEFEVVLKIDAERCVIKVIDHGVGMSSGTDSAEAHLPQVDSERGRGLFLMEKMVDSVEFESKPEAGTVVTLEKALTFEREPVFAAAKKPIE